MAAFMAILMIQVMMPGFHRVADGRAIFKFSLCTYTDFLLDALIMSNWHCSLSVGLYRCEVCGRTFQHSGSLRNHSKVHMGATRCPLCERTYNRVPDLRVHLTTVHQLSAADVYRLVPRLDR